MKTIITIPSDVSVRINPRPTATIEVPDGTLVRYAGTGVYVNSSRDDVAGQSHVTVNTEDVPDRDVLPDGCPALEVSLNDSTLYDREPAQGYVFAVVHVVEPRPGESVTEAWERVNTAMIDGQEGVKPKTLFATGPLLCPVERLSDPDFDVDVFTWTTPGQADTRVVLQPVPDEESLVPVPLPLAPRHEVDDALRGLRETVRAYLHVPGVSYAEQMRAAMERADKLVLEGE